MLFLKNSLLFYPLFSQELRVSVSYKAVSYSETLLYMRWGGFIGGHMIYPRRRSRGKQHRGLCTKALIWAWELDWNVDIEFL